MKPIEISVGVNLVFSKPPRLAGIVGNELLESLDNDPVFLEKKLLRARAQKNIFLALTSTIIALGLLSTQSCSEEYRELLGGFIVGGAISSGVRSITFAIFQTAIFDKIDKEKRINAEIKN